MEQELYLKLKDCLSPDNNIRKSAENYINDQKIYQPTNLLSQLFVIINEPGNKYEVKIKELSSILYKNILMENNNWINLPFLFKNKAREDIYNIIEKSNDENQIKYLCIIIANIAFKECECNDIKMLKFIIKKIEDNIKSSNNKNIISYLYIMKIFFERFEEQKLISIDVINNLQKVIMSIIKNFAEKGNSNNNIEERKLELCLEIYSLILPFLRYSFTMETDYIFKPIIDSLTKLNFDNIIYLKNLKVIDDTINYYHRYIVNHIKIICNLFFDLFDKILESNNKKKDNLNSINTKDEITENIILYYLDILCLICDKEIEDKTSLTNFYVSNADKYIPKLLNILKIYPEFKLNNESWNISRAVCYIISFIINSSKDETILTDLLNYSSKYFNSISYEEKINSLLILSCCLESKNLKIIYDTLHPEVLNLIKKINDNDSSYSYTVSWILGKISETIPSIFERDKFYEIIPTFINIINNKSGNIQLKYSNEIRINICIVFGNLIKFYGEEDIRKNDNFFKNYYKLFLNTFIDSSCNEENINSGLSFYFLRVIMNAIQFSSYDLQDNLEFLFSNLLNKFDNISNILITNKNKLNKDQIDKLNKLQEYLCLAINQIFNKIIRKINIELCCKLYNSIINSFLNRSPYEEGMLCLLNLIILLFNDENLKNMQNITNKINIDTFYKLIYAIFANDDNTNDNMRIIAVLCILNLLKINSSTLNNNIVEIYEVMKTLYSNKSDLKTEVKNLLIKATEEIEKNQIFKDKTSKNYK